MIFLMTLAQQFRRSPQRPVPTRIWSLKATVAAFWAAGLLVVVTSCGVLAAVGWVLLAAPEAAAAQPVEQVSSAVAQAAPALAVLREEQEF